MPTHFAVLGDIHAAWGQVKKAVYRYPDIPIRSVGDMGFGFPYEKRAKGRWVPDLAKCDPAEFPANFKFIRGNHDSPEGCRAHPNYLGDYGVDAETGLFFYSGAMSSDSARRTAGIDWWAEEELSMAEASRAITLYEQTKPAIVLSHDCPALLRHYLVSHHQADQSRTAQALDAMLEIHAPALWIFGHHHKVWQKKIGGTLFVCAAINQTLKFPLSA
ncbi:hypothetical protein BH09VER1_BH09VER1_44130 [soil metagenome]